MKPTQLEIPLTFHEPQTLQLKYGVLACGIYRIMNIKDGKMYIGSSSNIRVRWKTHRNKLNKNSHHNRKLQNAWNKHGAKSFVFEILALCEEPELFNMERAFLSRFTPYINGVGYNHRKDPVVNKNKKLSDTHRRRISESHKGIKHSEETKKLLSNIRLKNEYQSRKNYIVTSPDGIEFHIRGIRAFAREQGFNVKTFLNCKYKGRKYKGWTYRSGDTLGILG